MSKLNYRSTREQCFASPAMFAWSFVLIYGAKTQRVSNTHVLVPSNATFPDHVQPAV